MGTTNAPRPTALLLLSMTVLGETVVIAKEWGLPKPFKNHTTPDLKGLELLCFSHEHPFAFKDSIWGQSWGGGWNASAGGSSEKPCTASGRGLNRLHYQPLASSQSSLGAHCSSILLLLLIGM